MTQSHFTARPTGPGNANHTARPCRLVLPNTRRPVIAPTASPP
ncbi:hypothetical protein CKAH01_05931 [Colletotrichum kahawae]|uniref:Uncharacterized protein n=1 Tax=Colletotrichum kahawae TaxID=34407 RepID=A0AAE0D3R6_COLKA|nr:hypothetical protein CKAH01_05931 [Colletotrichum kahawae]